MKYDVHLYPIVRVKVPNIEANSHQEAIDAACERVNDDLYRMFDSAGSLGDPTIISETEYSEEDAYYLVDEDGDDDRENSRWYNGDRTPSDLCGQSVATQ